MFRKVMPIQNRSLRLNALLACAACTGLFGCGRSDEPRIEAKPPKVVRANLLTIGEQTVPGSYTVTGTIKSLLNATLASKVLGRVVEVHVREGDQIRQGQLLVSIDSRELQSAVDVADANYQASMVGVSSARTSAAMEIKSSKARIAQAESQVRQAKAALSNAEARRDLVIAGPRSQELAQSHSSVVQAESSLKLAKTELERTTTLEQEGVVSRRELDLAQNRFDVAKGQYDSAVLSENIAREGSRSQEIRAAQESVSQAKAAIEQAQSGLAQARASAMQIDVRQSEVDVASAQTKQMAAAARAARVSLSYGKVLAPFDGRVVGRMVDPGSMASPGVPLLSVEGGEYRFEAIVPESELSSLPKGGAAQVTIGALKGAPLAGKLVELAPQGDSATHSYLVRFALGTPAGVKSGMFGRASFSTGSSSRILIPASATWVRAGLNYVFALSPEGTARLRIVTVGQSFGSTVEVLSGLNKGDRIVVGELDNVSDGVKVEAK